MKKSIILAISFFLAITAIQSQPWMKLIPKSKQHNPSFFDIRNAFYAYWDKYEIKNGIYTDETGKKHKAYGYKQFKRWEWFMENRVNKDGYLPYDIYAKELQKIKQLKSSSGNWQNLGPFQTPYISNSSDLRGVGRINVIAFDPSNSNIIYIGAPAGGVWKTTDGGQSWTAMTEDLASLGVADIAIDPANSQIIYIATGDCDHHSTYSIGVLKSTDGGNTWNNTGLTFDIVDNLKLCRILINPQNTNIIYAAGSSGIFKSTDGGNSWSAISNEYVKDLELCPDDPNTIYAATYDPYGGETKILRSTDAGNTWQDITPSFSGVARIDLGVTPANGNVIYAFAANNTDYGFHSLWKSSDKGATWTELQNSSYSPNYLDWYSGDGDGGQGWYDLTIAVDPSDENHIVIGGINIWESTNGGMTFNQKTLWYHGGSFPYVHADQHHLIFSPQGILYSANDGGIMKYQNNTWINLSDGLAISQIYRLSTSQTTNDLVITGLQDNGTILRNNGTFSAVLGGDGMECLINPENNNIMYCEYYYGNMYKSTDGGNYFYDIAPASDGNWITPFVHAPDNPDIMYAGYTEMYKSTNGGETWTAVTNGITGGVKIDDIAVAPSNSNYIYFSANGDLYRSTNGGMNWSLVYSGFYGSISDIAVAFNNPNKVFVTISGFYSNNKVFYSEDGGSSWTNISDGLPNVPANTIVYENGSNDRIYVGTDLGVFVRNGLSASWEFFNNGMPNVVIDELEINYATNEIYAATFGRGLWKSDLYSDANAPLEAEFTYYVADNCNGEVLFYDNSSGQPVSWHWDFGDGNTSTDQNPTHYYSSPGTYTVTLTVEDSNQQTSQISHTVTINVTEVTANFSALPETNCSAPLTVQFTNLSANANSYLWDFGDGAVSTDENPSHTYTQAGTYSVKLVASSTICGADSIIKNNLITIDDSVTVNVNMPVNGVVTYTCCKGVLFDNGGENSYQNNSDAYAVLDIENADTIILSFDFFDLELNYDSLYIYSGTGNNLNLIGAFTGNALPNGNGTIIIPGNEATLHFKSDASVTGEGFRMHWQCSQDQTTVSEILNSQFNIFPNPAHGKFTIKANTQSPYSITIITLDGKTIFTKKNIETQTYQVGNLPQGVYLLNIKTKGKVVRTKIVIL